MSPKQPLSTLKPLAAHKERILSKGYICTEIQNDQQVVCIYKAPAISQTKKVSLHVIQN